jgi:hypothetical protein
MKYELIYQRATFALRHWWFGEDDTVRGIEYRDGQPVRTAPIVAIDVEMHLVRDTEGVVYLLPNLPDSLPGSAAAKLAQAFHAAPHRPTLPDDPETDTWAEARIAARNSAIATANAEHVDRILPMGEKPRPPDRNDGST